MAPPLKLSSFDRALLKIAAKSAVAAAKACKKSAQKALLTEAESEAHAMEGYADEAVRFLDAPEGPDQDEVQLVFGHRTALRTGCLIRIGELEDMESDQTAVLIDADGVTSTQRRAADFRRLEGLLRGADDPQAELPLNAAAPAPTPPPDGGDDEASEVAQGPFDQPPVVAPLALSAGAPSNEPDSDLSDVADAEFEVLDDADDDSDDTNRDDADQTQSDLESSPSDAIAASEVETEEWLAEPLRLVKSDPDDLVS